MGDTVLFPWRLQMDNNRISALSTSTSCMYAHSWGFSSQSKDWVNLL